MTTKTTGYRVRLALRVSIVGLLAMGSGRARAQQYFNFTTLTAGSHTVSNGSFTGAIGTTTVTGSATSATTGSFTYNPTTVGSTGLGDWELSNSGNTSPQYSYSTVYSNAAANQDAIGYTFWAGSTNTATVTMNFSKPMSNLVFQFANLDNSVWDFTPSGGVTGLTLLKGNDGADGDGIGVSGKTVIDRLTLDTAQSPAVTPSTNGTTKRSAYGSVLLNGTYSSLTINLTATHSNNGDGGNFTMVQIPEPGSAALALLSLAGGGLLLRRRSRV